MPQIVTLTVKCVLTLYRDGWSIRPASQYRRPFLAHVNVYAISNFLPSSFVLDHFFWYEIVHNQILYRNMYFKSRIFNIMANNKREMTHLCKN